MVRAGWVLFVLSLWGCEVAVAPAGTCGGEVCGAQQRCDEGAQRCVTDEAPTLSLTGPAGVVTTARFQVRGTTKDDVAVTQLQWSMDDGSWSDVSAMADGTFALDLEAPSLDATTLQVKVRAGDGKREVLQALTVTVDRVAPRVTLKSPVAGAVQTSARVPLVLTITDGSGVLAALTVAGRPINAPSVGDTSVDVDVPGGDLVERLIVYDALDVYGNRATDTVRVQVDDTAAAPVFLSPAPQAATTNAAMLRVQVQAVDRSSLAQVLLTQLDGGQVQAREEDAGVWGADFPLPAAEDTVRFTAEVVDTLGNRGTAVSAVQPFDRVAPQLSLLGPDAGTPVNAAFVVRAQANADAVSVEAQFAGATVALTEGASDAWQGTVPLMTAGDAVPSTLALSARDAVGNVTTLSSSVLVDTVAPRITFTAPAAEAKLNAANFAGTNDVQARWTVQDGDSSAGTRTVNGQSSTANQLTVTTSATDNGRGYTVTVVARDQLNEHTASLDFTVDRVVPTVTSWVPSANARNIDPRETRISFSEPVFGATTSTPALILTPAATGSWDTEHRTWVATGLTPYTVYSSQLASLFDAAGNPVASASRLFHTAPMVPDSGTVLATSVTGFEASADSDGVATIAIRDGNGFSVRVISPVTGTLEAPLLSVPGVSSSHAVSTWATVDGATLQPTNRRGVTYSLSGSTLERRLLSGYSPLPTVPAVSGKGGLLTMPPLPGEASTRGYGLVTSNLYERGGADLILLNVPTVLAQSSTDWVGASISSPVFTVDWSRFTCYRVGPPTAPYVCESILFSTSAMSATDVRATLSGSGGCLVVSWSFSNTWRGVFQPIESCSQSVPTVLPPSCVSDTLPSISLPSGFRAAPFTTNGEATLIAANNEDGSWRVGKLSNPASCNGTFTDIGAPLTETVTAAAPIQVGNKAALLYLDGASNLKLYVP